VPVLFERNSQGLKPLTPTGPQLPLLLAIVVVLVLVPLATLSVLSSARVLTDVTSLVGTQATSLVNHAYTGVSTTLHSTHSLVKTTLGYDASASSHE